MSRPKQEVIALTKNKELLKSIARDNYRIIEEGYGDDIANFRFTQEDFENSVYDEKRIDLYLRAKALSERVYDSKELYERYIANNRVPPEIGDGLKRHLSFLLDLSGTPEADIRNTALIKKASTREGAEEIFNEELKRVIKKDLTKLFTDDPEKILSYMEENYNDMQFLFAFSSEMGNGRINLDADVLKFLNENKAIFEQAGIIKSRLEYMSSNLFITTPAGMTIDDAMPGYAGLLADSVIKRNQGIAGYAPINPENPSSEAFSITFLNTLLDENENKLYNRAAQKLIEEKVFTKDFLFDTKATLNGEEISLYDGIKHYGELMDEYDNIPNELKGDITFDEFLKEKGKKDLFTKRKNDDHKLDAVNARIERADFVIPDMAIYNKFKFDMGDVENEVTNSNRTRSYVRCDAIRAYINSITDVHDMKVGDARINNEIKQMYALQARNYLKDKHDSRSSIWRFFHPFQNRNEQNTIEEIERTIVERWNLAEADINNLEARLAVINQNGAEAVHRMLDNIGTQELNVGTLLDHKAPINDPRISYNIPENNMPVRNVMADLNLEEAQNNLRERLDQSVNIGEVIMNDKVVGVNNPEIGEIEPPKQ